jgi:hypothetical protein
MSGAIPSGFTTKAQGGVLLFATHAANLFADRAAQVGELFGRHATREPP